MMTRIFAVSIANRLLNKTIFINYLNKLIYLAGEDIQECVDIRQH